MALCCLPFISSGCKQSETAVKESSISDALYQNLPFEMPKVQQPVFPAYEVNIEKFGAKGDGLFLNTKAINDAIKEVNQRGGGKVIIPEGVWLTGPIELLSNVNLYTEQNALVLFTGDFEAYPIIATSFEGLETRRCQSPISARNAENIAITGHGTFDGNGAEETGKAAVEIDKQIALKYEGKLTDNKVQQMMSEFKPTQDLHGMNAKYIYQNALQSSVFSHFADIDGNWNGLSVADVFGDKEIKVGYVNGWLSTSQNMAKIFIVLSLVIILLIAPVFSGEYGGVDNIILTSKYGKTKCATAKVLASLLSAVFITTLVVIFNLLIAVAIYGTEGLDCSILFAPIDFLEGYIPFNITCGTVLKYQILLAFMSAISVTGIVLILSAVCKSQMIAFVISAAIHVIPIMLPISETSALYRIIVLMPLFYSQYISIMSVEQMHNGMLYAVWSIPVAIALVVIGSIISHKAFSKHQVR